MHSKHRGNVIFPFPECTHMMFSFVIPGLMNNKYMESTASVSLPGCTWKMFSFVIEGLMNKNMGRNVNFSFPECTHIMLSFVIVCL